MVIHQPKAHMTTANLVPVYTAASETIFLTKRQAVALDLYQRTFKTLERASDEGKPFTPYFYQVLEGYRTSARKSLMCSRTNKFTGQQATDILSKFWMN